MAAIEPGLNESRYESFLIYMKVRDLAKTSSDFELYAIKADIELCRPWRLKGELPVVLDALKP